MASKPQIFVGQLLGVKLGLWVCPLSIRVRDRNNSFYLKLCHSPLSWQLAHVYLPSRRVEASIRAKCLEIPNVCLRCLAD